MEKIRHSWDKGKSINRTMWTEQQECSKCGLFRIKIFGKWQYSKTRTTDEYPFPEMTENNGCIK